MYTFSFCPVSEIYHENVWKLYGHNFSGAAIVFTIENDPKSWMNFHISEVKYESIEKFRSYFLEKEEFEKKYSITAHCDLSKLIGFHKEPKWENEKEVRLLTYYPYKHFEEYLKFSKTEFRLSNGRNRIVHYIKLPLWVDNNSPYLKSTLEELSRVQKLPADYFETRPKIKIKDILIGKNSGIDQMTYKIFRNELKDIIELNYGYNIDLRTNLFEL